MTTTVLVTGAAGFIGYHVADRLLRDGARVVGLDNLNHYYDESLKRARLARLTPHERFHFVRVDVADQDALQRVFDEHQPQRVVHLAAQAGVRYSLEAPQAYVRSNLVGFANVLEACRHHDIAHLVYASSSSVYGGNETIPFSEQHRVDHPMSLYAATKKSNELMAHTYAHLFALPCTGLRFFTVYGPWGRPDMALFLFVSAIIEGRPIRVFNHGDMRRDFTHVTDIVEGVVRVLDHIPEARDGPPNALFNIGRGQAVPLMRFIEVIEECVGAKAHKHMLPMQPGDVAETFADTTALKRAVGFRPDISIEAGVKSFVDWYRDYYEVAP